MSKANEAAFPRPYSHDERPSGGHEGDKVETFYAFTGLTKREYFAAIAMQGMLSNSLDTNNGVEPYSVMGYEKICKYAVDCADELLKQLDQ